jgi:hypothetical protein
MLTYPKIGMGSLGPQANNDIWFWWYDELVRQWIVLYYWPYFVSGNLDNWMKMGVTLNGVRPMCKG